MEGELRRDSLVAQRKVTPHKGYLNKFHYDYSFTSPFVSADVVT